MRQRRERCFSVVIADSDVRPLAQHSVRSEGWKCKFVLIELNLYRVIRRDESADEEGRSNSTHTRKPQPLVIEPVVDLNEPGSSLSPTATCVFMEQLCGKGKRSAPQLTKSGHSTQYKRRPLCGRV